MTDQKVQDNEPTFYKRSLFYFAQSTQKLLLFVFSPRVCQKGKIKIVTHTSETGFVISRCDPNGWWCINSYLSDATYKGLNALSDAKNNNNEDDTTY